MKLYIINLLILFAYCCIGVHTANDDFGKALETYLPTGEPCGIGVNGMYGTKCCPGAYCVSGVCKVFAPMSKPSAGGNPFAGSGKQPPPHLNVGVEYSNSRKSLDYSQEQQCDQRLKSAGCGLDVINASGPLGQFQQLHQNQGQDCP